MKMRPARLPCYPKERNEMKTNWTYSEAEKALGHEMQAKTGRTDECVNCGAMVNDCQNWPGRTGGTVFF